ncbi:SusF/SusE family outer membrane protein [Fulvivirga sp. M361]|uniref:SusE domain-containing protein n=1 Tax=Fulvivirga sp. M361 TaxID=2594266 RepID=UPI00117BD2CD|nr:SusE domain-containing protein [Fulvivirga sp. M361]TRX59544.1 SusF/SusE family outer membrane protein [Fulvivirga sp. M361]
MKKISYIFLALGLLACDQEDFPSTTGLESLRDFNLNPIEGSTVNLSSINRDGEIVVEWGEARSGLNSDVIYTWMLDEADGDFSDPILSFKSDQEGLSNSITFTNQALDDLLIDLGLSIGEQLEGQWTVSATNGDITTVADPAVITIRRFINEIAPFNLATPADNQYAGLFDSDPDSEVVIQWDSTFAGFGTDVTYQWVADTAGGDFSEPLVTLDAEQSGTENELTITHQALLDLLADLNVPMGTFVTLDWKVIAATEDITKISEDVFSISLVKPVGPSKFMVGAATPAGWGWDNPIEMFQVQENTWVSFLNFSNDAFRFFAVRGDWDSGSNYPFYEGEGFTIDAAFEDANDDSNNFRFIGEIGAYKITLDENNKAITLD